MINPYQFEWMLKKITKYANFIVRNLVMKSENFEFVLEISIKCVDVSSPLMFSRYVYFPHPSPTFAIFFEKMTFFKYCENSNFWYKKHWFPIWKKIEKLYYCFTKQNYSRTFCSRSFIEISSIKKYPSRFKNAKR